MNETRKFEKISDVAFKVSETREVKAEINIPEKLSYFTTVINSIKAVKGEIEKLRNATIQNVKNYETWREVVNDAIEKEGFDFEKIPELKLDDDFIVDNIDLEKLPKIEIKETSSKAE